MLYSHVQCFKHKFFGHIFKNQTPTKILKKKKWNHSQKSEYTSNYIIIKVDDLLLEEKSETSEVKYGDAQEDMLCQYFYSQRT